MARRPFGGTAADVTTDLAGDVVAGASLTVWTGQSGGTQLTDLQTPAGVALAGGTVVSDAHGLISFLGPADGTASVWVDGGAGVRVLMNTTDLPSRVTTLEAGGGGAVSSVAGRTGAVTLTKADVGLGSVDNTADSSKPVSTAQQAALDLKAPLASPALSGVPTVPTATAGTNTTQAASTAFVQTAVAGAALPVVQYVIHGSTGSTVRPTTSGPVEWTGSVTPANAAQDDLWRDTTTSPSTLKIRGASAFSAVASGVTQAQALGYALVFGGN